MPKPAIRNLNGSRLQATKLWFRPLHCEWLYGGSTSDCRHWLRCRATTRRLPSTLSFAMDRRPVTAFRAVRGERASVAAIDRPVASR
jgi:hypothetical protein